MLEPGAELVYAWPSFSMYPHLAAASGARAITVPLDDEGFHDLEAMAREVTAATRIVIVCNPNNPTRDRARARRDRRLRRRAAAPRLRDPRRGLRRVLDAAGPRRLARPARASTPTSCCCARSRRSTASAGCASATRSAPRRSGSRSTACASRSRSTRSRRRPRPRRLPTRTRSSGASSGPRSSVCTSSRSSSERGLAQHRQSGELLLDRPRRPRRGAGRRRAWPSAA